LSSWNWSQQASHQVILLEEVPRGSAIASKNSFPFNVFFFPAVSVKLMPTGTQFYFTFYQDYINPVVLQDGHSRN
jgi:hypothetical protein